MMRKKGTVRKRLQRHLRQVREKAGVASTRATTRAATKAAKARAEARRIRRLQQMRRGVV